MTWTSGNDIYQIPQDSGRNQQRPAKPCAKKPGKKMDDRPTEKKVAQQMDRVLKQGQSGYQSPPFSARQYCFGINRT